MHSTFIYSTELDCSALFHSALHHPAVHFTIVHCTEFYCAVLYCIAHHVERSGVSDTQWVCSPLELEESEQYHGAGGRRAIDWRAATVVLRRQPASVLPVTAGLFPGASQEGTFVN